MSRRLLGERVVVKVQGCPTRDGVLISGVKKPSKVIQKFPVRFPNGDVRTYRGDQLMLRGSQAPPLEYVRVGDIIFTKKTLGVVRFIGLHEDYVGTVIVLEPIDPKLPTDPDVASFRKVFPSANLADSRAYNILRGVEEVLKVLPPDGLLQQLSKIKDKYLAFVEESRERDRFFEEDMRKRLRKIADIENEIKEWENVSGNESDSEDNEDEDALETQIVFKPGRLGVKAMWETGEIEGVSANQQAEKLGVKVGWTIVKVDDEKYSEAVIDRKSAGDLDYVLTFRKKKSPKIKAPDEPQIEPKIEPPKAESTDFKNILVAETDREQYERRIHELNDQIEDFQYTIEALQNKNTNMMEEHKQLPKLRNKVLQLRNSKTMFIGQIKEVQKREKEWKAKAEENEQKYNKLLLELQSGDPQSKKIEDSPKDKDSEATKARVRIGTTHKRKRSVQMPQPDSANTLSIGSQPAPQIGAGSAQTVSISSLADGNKPSGKIKPKKNPRFPRW